VAADFYLQSETGRSIASEVACLLFKNGTYCLSINTKKNSFFSEEISKKTQFPNMTQTKQINNIEPKKVHPRSPEADNACEKLESIQPTVDIKFVNSNPTPVLRKNMRNVQFVLKAIYQDEILSSSQMTLYQKEYVAGEAGNVTKFYLRKFQTESGLSADGIIGGKTSYALSNARYRWCQEYLSSHQS